MISDGVINSKESFGKDWIEEFLRNVSSNNAQKLSDLLMEEVLQNYYDIPQDDITIIVAKIVKK
jgi:serine phosphatase RsbU (regulator of sigma subunit)